jgi:glycine C-acetyltransferase
LNTRYSQDSREKNFRFYGTEDTILYAAAFDANGGFLSLYLRRDAIISDSLNHASIIDGVRLCKAARYRYANCDMEDLEQQLIKANEAGSRFKIIVTDGVFLWMVLLHR